MKCLIQNVSEKKAIFQFEYLMEAVFRRSLFTNAFLHRFGRRCAPVISLSLFLSLWSMSRAHCALFNFHSEFNEIETKADTQ